MELRTHGSKAHSDVATTLCSHAGVYRAQGRLDEAASLQQESVAMVQRTHGGKNHRDGAGRCGLRRRADGAVHVGDCGPDAAPCDVASRAGRSPSSGDGSNFPRGGGVQPNRAGHVAGHEAISSAGCNAEHPGSTAPGNNRCQSGSMSAPELPMPTPPARDQPHGVGQIVAEQASSAPATVPDETMAGSELVPSPTVAAEPGAASMSASHLLETSAAGADRGGRNAVCIGFCPTYETHAEHPTTDCTVASVDHLLAALVQRCGFMRQCIVSGASVTPERIVQSVAELASELQPGALVVAHYCGHGVKYGGNIYLVADDGVLVTARLLASSMAGQVVKRELTDVHLLVVIDFCHFEVLDTLGELRYGWAL